MLYENERRNFYPVTHAAAAVWECAASDLTGFLHIGASTSASRFEFGRCLIEAVGLDPALATPTTGPGDRPSDLTLTVDRAGEVLSVPMPTISDVIAEVQRDIGVT